MNILEIYRKYQIMPQLAEHQLKVAAVADVICKHITRGMDAELLQPLNNAEKEIKIDQENIIKACLLHDMGNIVKFDLTKAQELYPELFIKSEERAFWENVKQEFIEKYGSISHQATDGILKETGVSNRILELVDGVGFDQAVDNLQSEDFGKKICAYSDMRVGPKGVISLEERFADLRVRYKSHPEGAQNREVFEDALRQIEQQIFERCKIRPEAITEDGVKDRVEKLKEFEISTVIS